MRLKYLMEINTDALYRILHLYKKTMRYIIIKENK